MAVNLRHTSYPHCVGVGTGNKQWRGRICTGAGQMAGEPTAFLHVMSIARVVRAVVH